MIKMPTLSAVSLGVAFATGYANANQSPNWFIAPSIELTQHHADLKKAEQSDSTFFETINIDIDGLYRTRVQETSLRLNTLHSTKPTLEDSDYTRTTYQILQQWNYDQESSPLRFALGTRKDYQTSDDARRGLIEDLYSSEEYGVEKVHHADVRYLLPKGSLVDLSADWSLQKAEFENNALSSKSNTSTGSVTLSKRLVNQGLNISITQSDSRRWQDLNDSSIESRFQESSRTVNLGKSVISNVDFVLRHTYSEYRLTNEQNQPPSRSHETHGAGLSLEDRQSGNYITIRRDYDKTENKWSWGTSSRWFISERYQLNANWQKRFFGEAGDISFSGTFGRHSFSLEGRKDIDFRYINGVERRFEGLYACPVSTSIFDSDLCNLPDDGTTDLSPDFVLIPKFTDYPTLQPSISLTSRVSVFYRAAFDTLTLKVRGSLIRDEDRRSLFNQDSKEASIELTKNLSENHRVIMTSTFRGIGIDGVSKMRRDWSSSIVFQKDVNKRAQWEIGLYNGHQDPWITSPEIKEKRVSATYRIHFGKKNPNLK